MRPENRKELINVATRGACAANAEDTFECKYPDCDCNAYSGAFNIGQSVVAAIEAAGCSVVPNEATEEMIIAGVHHENMGDMAGRYNAMLTHSPYRRNK